MLSAPFLPTRSGLARVNWWAVGVYYVLACGLSFAWRHLPNPTAGLLPAHTLFTYGLGPVVAALLTHRLFAGLPRPVTTSATPTPNRVAGLLALVVTTLPLAESAAQGTTATPLPDAPPLALPREELRADGSDAFGLLDKAFYQNQLFLLGETHGFGGGQELDFAWLKHLNNRIGLRHYVAEVDPTKAYYLNQYLQTGQDSTLRLVFRSWIADNAQWANRNFYEKIGKIRALNQALPAHRRIRFVGIDAPHDAALVARQLRELTAGHPLTPSGRALRDTLVARLTTGKPGRLTDSLRATVAQRWLADLRTNARPHRRLPAGNVVALEATLTGLVYAHSIRNRERILFAHFSDAVQRLNLANEKLYGFWGAYHVWQAPLADGRRPFAALVRASALPMRDRVVSITCQYVDSRMMVPTAFLPPMWQEAGKRYSRVATFNHNGPMLRASGIDTLLAQSRPNRFTLFRLTGTELGRQPIRMRYAAFMPKNQRIEFDPARPATDYYQYVLLVRNAEATEPLVP